MENSRPDLVEVFSGHPCQFQEWPCCGLPVSPFGFNADRLRGDAICQALRSILDVCVRYGVLRTPHSVADPSEKSFLSRVPRVGYLICGGHFMDVIRAGTQNMRIAGAERCAARLDCARTFASSQAFRCTVQLPSVFCIYCTPYPVYYTSTIRTTNQQFPSVCSLHYTKIK